MFYCWQDVPFFFLPNKTNQWIASQELYSDFHYLWNIIVKKLLCFYVFSADIFVTLCHQWCPPWLLLIKTYLGQRASFSVTTIQLIA